MLALFTELAYSVSTILRLIGGAVIFLMHTECFSIQHTCNMIVKHSEVDISVIFGRLFLNRWCFENCGCVGRNGRGSGDGHVLHQLLGEFVSARCRSYSAVLRRQLLIFAHNGFAVLIHIPERGLLAVPPVLIYDIPIPDSGLDLCSRREESIVELKIKLIRTADSVDVEYRRVVDELLGGKVLEIPGDLSGET